MSIKSKRLSQISRNENAHKEGTRVSPCERNRYQHYNAVIFWSATWPSAPRRSPSTATRATEAFRQVAEKACQVVATRWRRSTSAWAKWVNVTLARCPRVGRVVLWHPQDRGGRCRPEHAAQAARVRLYAARQPRARLIVHESLLPAIEPIRDQLPSLKHIVVIGQRDGYQPYAAWIAGQPATLATAPTHRDDICSLNFSSGTTGEPKGILHAHKDYPLAAQFWGRAGAGPARGRSHLWRPQLFFTFGLGGNLIFPWYVGASCALYAGAITQPISSRQWRTTGPRSSTMRRRAMPPPWRWKPATTISLRCGCASRPANRCRACLGVEATHRHRYHRWDRLDQRTSIFSCRTGPATSAPRQQRQAVPGATS